MYYKDIHGVFLVFDLTDEDSFKNVNIWVSELKKHAPEKIVLILIGNKSDLCQVGDDNETLNNDRQVSEEQAQYFANENKMIYFECSAKTGYNINKMFDRVAKEINSMNKVVDLKNSKVASASVNGQGSSILDGAIKNNTTKLNSATHYSQTYNQPAKSGCCK